MRLSLVAILIVGCGARNGLAIEEDLVTIDAGRPDAGRMEIDAGPGCSPETCNALDDDCDGRIDEMPGFFRDRDLDGVGADMTTVCFSGTPEGGDCDDGDPTIRPGAPEICMDGRDNDCDELIDCADPSCDCGPDVIVPIAPYSMGSPLDEAGREDDEVLHVVTVTRPFALMRTEVTQAEWERVTGSRPSFFADCDDCPVETINWYEALELANRRSDLDGLERCYELSCTGTLGAGCPRAPDPSGWVFCTGDFTCSVAFAGLDCRGWRLPTEAEWELAARAGSRTAFPIGDDITRVPEIGWCTSNAERRTHSVAQKAANPWGLHDMAGNVYEWTWDWYAPYEGEVDPMGPPVGMSRVIRGGSFAFGDFACRSANRGARSPSSRENVVGVRLARTL